MNTIVAFSDSHGLKVPDNLVNIINETKYVFFLGDGINSLGDVLFHKELHIVKGNCDYISAPEEEVIEIDKVKVLITHGHKYHVKSDLIYLLYRAKELGCKLVFYGHTHFASIEEQDGITLINPGSLQYPMTGQPSYAYVVINGEKIVSKIVNLN